MVQIPIRSLAQGGAGFGTSGVRGTVEALTDRVCFAYAAAFLDTIVERDASGGDRVVAIGHDLRPSSPRMVAACVAACEARRTRAVRIVEKLNALGVMLGFDAVLAQSDGAAIGRP